MNIWGIVAIVVVVALAVVYMRRTRTRQAMEQNDLVSRIDVGTEVMTTSGLYGVVVHRNLDDDTVQLQIAPGVEVKWALAALRDAAALSDRYRQGMTNPGPDDPGSTSPDDGLPGPTTI